MTISYPRTLPSTRVLRVTFEAEPAEAMSPEQGGRFVSTMLGPSLWELKLDTTPSNEIEFSKWRAWLDSLDGAGKEFYGYDVRRPLPWKYRSGFAGLVRAVSLGAFNGTSTSWSTNTTRDEITIGAASGQELPVGLNLIEGDYIGLVWTTSSAPRRSVHRVLEDRNADANGVGVWSVRPHIDPRIVPDAATINLVKPSALMAISKRERQAEHKSRAISFEAVQNLAP